MKTKLRFEPPLLVDMKGPEMCGEFITCLNGTYAALGSCKESTRCGTGTQAEWCGSGSNACGCDSCCQSGTGYSSTGGYPWVSGCLCFSGQQAYESCSDGNYTSGPCESGEWAENYTCNGGSHVYNSYGYLQNCDSGT